MNCYFSQKVLFVLMGICFLFSIHRTMAETLPVEVPQFVERYCIDCHDDYSELGDRSFEAFLKNPDGKEQHLILEEILDQLNLGQMPPKEEGILQPDAEERNNVVAAITHYLQQVETSEIPPATVLRRLTRHEYNNTMRDLLDVHPESFDPTSSFPMDVKHEGFVNVGSEQTLSNYQLELYLKAAKAYLEKTIVFNQERPETQKWVFHPEDFISSSTVDISVFYRVLDRENRWVDIGHGEPVDRYPTYPKNFSRKGVPEDGFYRIQITAEAVGRRHPYDPEIYRCDLGMPLKMGLWHVPERDLLLPGASEGRVFVEAFDLKDNEPSTFEVMVWLPAGSTPYVHWINGQGSSKPVLAQVQPEYHPETERLNPVEIDELRARGEEIPPQPENQPYLSDVYEGPRVRLHGMTLEGPLCEEWPPRGHREIFGSSTDPKDFDLPQTLTKFATRAFRRPVKPEEINHYLEYVRAQMKSGVRRADAIALGLTAILSSPRFLYLDEGNSASGEKLDDFELASRLSYTFWSSMPDQRLFDLAAANRLHEPEVLYQEVERLLNDPKASSFTQHFTDAWLRLDKLGSMPPSNAQFPTYYLERLEEAMTQETRLFFQHILEENRPVTEFLSADYTFVNDRLAKHYGLPKSQGETFRKVALPANLHRGGLLGHASVLTASANGVETSPVVRGVWLLESILGTPPSPPPPDVPPIEPDTRGATTIRDQLAKHRSVAACANCHAKIDPWGFALEYYDPTGGFRDHYVIFRGGGRIARRRQGRPVNGSGQLPSGEKIQNEADLKALLLERKDLFTKNLAQKLLIYATGREMNFRDQPEINRITEEIAAQGDGFRDLVHAVVLSDIFQNR
ncbi:Cytochrome c domain-containing protein [Planctomycetales bacterium 10988]|nr:Cytochrome c domain-containing protein [Planctomycetales bacterium 10988]